MPGIEDEIAQHKAQIARLEAELAQRSPLPPLERAGDIGDGYRRDLRAASDYRAPAYDRGYSLQPPSRTAFYLDKKHAKFLGVCSGLADYTGLDAIWFRLAMVASLLLSGGASFFLYIAAAILAKPRPEGLYDSREDQKFWQGVRQNSSRTAKDVRSKLRDIDRRIGDIEAHYVSTNRRLADEIDALK